MWFSLPLSVGSQCDFPPYALSPDLFALLLCRCHDFPEHTWGRSFLNFLQVAGRHIIPTDMPPSIPSRTAIPVRISPTNSSVVPPTQVPRLQAIQPLAASTPSTSTPDAVLLDLHTTIVIPDYYLYYHAPISSFHPTYHALADGSLVATPFIADMRSANIHLACISAITMFFLVTTLTTAQYIRRGKIKKKGLFWFLLFSQLLGMIAMLSMIVPFFDQFVGCKA